uniref:Exonuclease n=1 Tax=Marseillevirus LCMAC201 TaxID=2506605 RepID=A0A481YX71_9VIRU|nr:MAG: exonuclease [Marseillevirus LCMAC201]
MVSLSQKNIHPRDKHIQFDDPTHIYTIDGDSNYKSVTTWIHEFFPHFDADKIIAKMRKGNNWNPSNKYYKLTDEQIKEGWNQNGQEAATLGTEMHLNIENFYNEQSSTLEFKNTPEYKLFRGYLQDHMYETYRTEWMVYSKKYRLAGSIDIVYIDPNDADKVILADWKRSKEIRYSNRWEKGFGPLAKTDNCNYHHYCLQLNIYRMILEKYYGKTVTEMFLVILHPNQKKYIKIVIPRIWKPIMGMLADRLRSISL